MRDKLNLEAVVKFHGYIEPQDLSQYYMHADGFLLTLDDSTNIGDTIPAKLQGYMSAGKPVFALAGKGVQHILMKARCGYAFPTSEVTPFAEALIKFIREPNKFAEIGQNARSYYLEHFTFDKFMHNLYTIMDDLVYPDNPGGKV